MKRLTCMLGLVAASTSAAWGQFLLGALNEQLRGEGRMVITGQSSADLTNATVLLMRDQKGEVSLSGRGRTFQIDGRWRRISDEEYRLSATSALGDRNGTGELRFFFERKTLTSLDGRGTANGRAYTFSLDRDDLGHGSGNWDSLSTSANGEGTLRRDRDRVTRFDRVSVVLSRNGQAEVSFRGEANREFIGTWRRRTGETVSLDLDSGFGNSRVSGTGFIEFRGRQIRVVRMSGRQGTAAFSVDFTARGGISSPDFDGMNVTSTGRGAIEIEDRKSTISEMRVWLKPGGTAELTLYSTDRERRLTGTWHDQGRDTVNVNINGGMREPTNGQATIRLRNQVFTSVEGSGRSNARRFTFSFRAN